MIHGIGTDIVAVARMAEALERHGDKFAERILADCELEAYRTAHDKARFLAKRFAAKEAVAKALGTGFSGGLSLRHIATEHDELGRPLLQFFDYGTELTQKLGIGETFVSIADEQDYALAYVTLLRR